MGTLRRPKIIVRANSLEIFLIEKDPFLVKNLFGVKLVCGNVSCQ
jgi:hypothetical protein